MRALCGDHHAVKARPLARRGSPVRVRLLPALHLVPVVAVVDDAALRVEAEDGRAGECDDLVDVSKARPPLNGSPLAISDRLCEAAGDLDAEVLAQVAAGAARPSSGSRKASDR